MSLDGALLKYFRLQNGDNNRLKNNKIVLCAIRQIIMIFSKNNQKAVFRFQRRQKKLQNVMKDQRRKRWNVV